MTQSPHKAAVPNPALNPFNALIGAWRTAATHPQMPGTVFHGRTWFEWLEGGAFIIMRSEVDEAEVPDGIAIFCSDDKTGDYFMLYFDEREVSRKYDVSIQGNVLKWSREAPEFSQRFAWTFSDDGNTITSKGEMCEDGKTWKGDLEQTFTRIAVAASTTNPVH